MEIPKVLIPALAEMLPPTFSIVWAMSCCATSLRALDQASCHEIGKAACGDILSQRGYLESSLADSLGAHDDRDARVR